MVPILNTILDRDHYQKLTGELRSTEVVYKSLKQKKQHKYLFIDYNGSTVEPEMII